MEYAKHPPDTLISGGCFLLQRIGLYLQNHLVLFMVGALGYGGIEVLFRGYTHWTMLLAGGLCLLGLQTLDHWLFRLPLLMRSAAGALFITGVELCFGLVCNRCLHWGVWDYSAYWGNLWGQICPLFTFFWFLLCIPIFWAFGQCRHAWED